jgi:hypothetical protein
LIGETNTNNFLDDDIGDATTYYYQVIIE